MEHMEDLMAIIARIREENGGVIEAHAALAEGVTHADLSDLCQQGKIVRIGRGQFVVPKNNEDKMVSLAQNKNLLFSHQTALYLHGILEEPGEMYSVTYPEGTEADPVVRAQCDVHYVPREYYELGRTLATTPAGNLVPAYDMERSVCDIAIARDVIGSEAFLTVVTNYALDPRCNEMKLYDYGDRLNISYVLRCYLEVLMWAKHG